MLETDAIDTTTDNTDTGENVDTEAETGLLDADVIGPGETDTEADSTEEDTDDSTADATEEDAEQEGAPESYEDFTVKEGFAMNEGATEAVTALAKKLGLKQEGAQDIVNAFTEHTEATTKALNVAQDEAIAQEKVDNVATLKKEWGKQYDANKNTISKFFDTFCEGTEAGKKITEYFSSDPVLARLMLKAGKAISEDTREVGGVEEVEKTDTLVDIFPQPPVENAYKQS